MSVGRLSGVTRNACDVIVTATLSIETSGEGFIEITGDAVRFLAKADAASGALFAFVRHTSASLTIQENADPDVRTDLLTALRRLAPQDVGWIHDTEGPEDMPAHVRAMVTGVSLHVPVIDGAMALGAWQSLYLVEHRARPHHREVVLQFIGATRAPMR